MSFEEIASRAGKPVGKVVYWSSCPSWEKFTVGDALLFSTACGVDLLRPRKKLFYLRRAFAEKGFQTLAKGLPRGYVEKQIRIRQRYEKRQSGIVNTN